MRSCKRSADLSLARSEAPAPVPRPAAAAASPPAKPPRGEPKAGTPNRSRQPTGDPGAQRSARARPTVLPPQRPHPRQSRLAASRKQVPPIEAGSRPGTPRLPSQRPEKSPGRGRKPLPGFRPRRKEAESFFPATCAAGKIPLTERRVKRVRSLWDRTLFAPKRSARPLRHRRRGRVPSCRPLDGTGRSLAGMFLGTFRRRR